MKQKGREKGIKISAFSFVKKIVWNLANSKKDFLRLCRIGITIEMHIGK